MPCSRTSGPTSPTSRRNGSRISADTQQVIQSIREGEGTIGKLINDDTLYRRASEIATEAKSVMENVKEVSVEARRAIADFRSKDGPAQGLMADMRITLSQAREATADLADNMEAMKHNFLLRGYFNRRGYFDLDAISPAEYRKGVLENGKRKAMRIWLADGVLFQTGPEGTETPDRRRTRPHRLGDGDLPRVSAEQPDRHRGLRDGREPGRALPESPTAGGHRARIRTGALRSCHRRTWAISRSGTTPRAVRRATAGMAWR